MTAMDPKHENGAHGTRTTPSGRVERALDWFEGEDTEDSLVGKSFLGLRSVTRFLGQYVFSRDHKIIGIQFLITTLLMFLLGGALALAVRWQLAWPWREMPVVGK